MNTCRVCYIAVQSGATECPNGHTTDNAPCAPPQRQAYEREETGPRRSSEPRAAAPANTPPRPSARDSGVRQAPIDVRDPYAVLGITRSATDDDVHAAFRSAAKRLHPDLHPNLQNGDLKFREATFARDVLLDSNRRSMFDEFGHASFAPNFDPSAARSRLQIPTDGIESVEFVGHGIKMAADFLKTEDGQRAMVQGLRGLSKLQTAAGQEDAKKAIISGAMDWLSKA